MAKVVEMIQALERERFRAMVEGDAAQLEQLLSEQVGYIHTNGKRETKQQFIASITAGRRRYRQIEVQSQDVMPLGRETCIVIGRALMEMGVGSGTLLFPVAYTAVHAQEQGHWRLLAWQATRCAMTD